MTFAQDGYEIKVGDVIVATHAFGSSNHQITRVTKTMAIVRNGIRYPRIYRTFGFRLMGATGFPTTSYRVLIK